MGRPNLLPDTALVEWSLRCFHFTAYSLRRWEGNRILKLPICVTLFLFFLGALKRLSSFSP